MGKRTLNHLIFYVYILNYEDDNVRADRKKLGY